MIVILSGAGECTVEGETSQFGPNSTLIIEPDAVHQIVNTSNDEIKLVAIFGKAGIRVKTADGDHMPVPWEAP